MKGVMGAFKLATPAIAYVASGFPSAVLVYWVTHNSFSVLQAFLLKIPAFKRWADIPDPPIQDKKTAGVGFMQAFRDTKEAFGDLKEGAVERTDRKFAEGQQEKALDKQVEERAARKKATLEKLKASGSAVDDAEMSAADEKQARIAAARKRRESHRNRRTRI
jgi:YidC/Oxa1 family membrane protein insertase